MPVPLSFTVSIANQAFEKRLVRRLMGILVNLGYNAHDCAIAHVLVIGTHLVLD